MKNALLFNFSVDKSSNKISISREFAAEQQLVWDAFTTKELLDKWWAPAPWQSKTASMNFEVGGKRVYAMCGPEGEEHWAIQEFTSISAITNFQFEDAFADKEGVKIEAMPAMHWNLNFSGSNETTLVDIVVSLKSLEQLEQIIQMGFKEGFSVGLDQLERVLGGE